MCYEFIKDWCNGGSTVCAGVRLRGEFIEVDGKISKKGGVFCVDIPSEYLMKVEEVVYKKPRKKTEKKKNTKVEKKPTKNKKKTV